jgi:hypothetical protein
MEVPQATESGEFANTPNDAFLSETPHTTENGQSANMPYDEYLTEATHAMSCLDFQTMAMPSFRGLSLAPKYQSSPKEFFNFNTERTLDEALYQLQGRGEKQILRNKQRELQKEIADLKEEQNRGEWQGRVEIAQANLEWEKQKLFAEQQREDSSLPLTKTRKKATRRKEKRRLEEEQGGQSRRSLAIAYLNDWSNAAREGEEQLLGDDNYSYTAEKGAGTRKQRRAKKDLRKKKLQECEWVARLLRERGVVCIPFFC